jgi:mannose/fructose-specific phosphotransferase system component IIA
MTVGIVVVTHGQAGKAMLKVAEFILDQPLTGIRFIPFNQSESHTTGNEELKAAIRESDDGDGVLILTDLIGASPANLVADLLQEFQAVMVTGINLAMLLRVWNYRNQSLTALASKAVEGGKRGIEAFKS